jgi:hypothetical protein
MYRLNLGKDVHEGQNGNQEQLAIPVQAICSVKVEYLAGDDSTLIHNW